MSEEVHEITQGVRRQLDRLDKVVPGGDWVDEWVEGDAIRTRPRSSICSGLAVAAPAEAEVSWLDMVVAVVLGY